MFSKISRLDRLPTLGASLKAAVAAVAAAIMLSSLSPASAQPATEAPPVAEAPAAEAPAAPTDAAPEAVAAEEPAAAEEAAPAPKVYEQGNLTWMLVSTILVLMMIVPGLALFYGGLVRTKNMLSMLMQVTTVTVIGMIAWALWGYSLSFTDGGELNKFVGGFSKLFLAGTVYHPTDIFAGVETFSVGVYIPEIVFVCFQMTFACITAALVLGGVAERLKFAGVVLFAVLWPILSYYPMAHMVWWWSGATSAVGQTAESLAAGAGQIWAWGALDFAGGTVVHINAGVAGLICALVLGKRVGFGKDLMAPHNLTFVLAGTGLLLFGWYGFNAGSSLESNGLTALVILNTTIAAGAAALAWTAGEWIFRGHPSLLGGASGMVAGLVAITPACGWVGPGGAILIGLVAGFVCLWAVVFLKSRLGYDDALDVFGVHGIGGIVGAILTGIFVNPALGGMGVVDYLAADTSVGAAPYAFGTQLYAQVVAVVIAVVWTAIVSYAALMICKVTVGLRVKEQEEREGLDVVDHGERAYN